MVSPQTLSLSSKRLFLQGGDCFGAFMQWGLPKGTLKDVWAAVAGDEGYLSQQQFVQCLYLMDNAKRVGPFMQAQQ